MDRKKLPSIALGIWAWGAGIAGVDQVFDNNLQTEDLLAAKAGVDTRGDWENPMA